MPDAPTPGEVAYTAYYHTRLRLQHRSVILTWTELTTNEQAAWEAAAQAVQDRVMQELVTGFAQGRQEREGRGRGSRE